MLYCINKSVNDINVIQILILYNKANVDWINGVSKQENRQISYKSLNKR